MEVLELAGAIWQDRVSKGISISEMSEISLHEIRVYAALAQHRGWLSNSDIAQANGVAGRTARAHMRRLARLGLMRRPEFFQDAGSELRRRETVADRPITFG